MEKIVIGSIWTLKEKFDAKDNPENEIEIIAVGTNTALARGVNMADEYEDMCLNFRYILHNYNLKPEKQKPIGRLYIRKDHSSVKWFAVNSKFAYDGWTPITVDEKGFIFKLEESVDDISQN